MRWDVVVDFGNDRFGGTRHHVRLGLYGDTLHRALYFDFLLICRSLYCEYLMVHMWVVQIVSLSLKDKIQSRLQKQTYIIFFIKIIDY